jgi:hypothetical protein
MKLFIRASAEL